MASNTHEFQFAVPTCKVHSNEEVFSYCNTCLRKICELCVKGDHNNHDWSTISKHARKIRNEGIKISEQVIKEIVPVLRSKTSRERKESNSKGIIQTKQALKESIYSYANQLLSVIDDEGNDDEDLERMIGQFIKISEFFKDNIHLAHDNVVIDMKEEYCNKIEEYRHFMKQSTGYRFFKEGSLLENKLEAIFGHLVIGNPDLKVVSNLVSTFTFGTQAIIGVVATSKGMAWIHHHESSKNVLLTESGKRMLEVDFGQSFNSFIIKGRSYVITCTSEEVVREHKDGKLGIVYNTSPLYPTGLCESRDGGLLICLIECDRRNITHNTKGEVHHIDISGNIIKKYVIDKDRKSVLFTWPNRVAQNVNLDICVLDFIDDKLNDRLVVVSMDGSLRFIYNGQHMMKKRFVARQVVCDDSGRIFLIDTCNDVIHVLNSEGHFLQFIMNADGINGPCSLSIYNDTMWVVGKKGAVSTKSCKNRKP